MDLRRTHTSARLCALLALTACDGTVPLAVTAADEASYAVFGNGNYESSTSSKPQPWTNLVPAPTAFGPEYPPPSPWSVSSYENIAGPLQVPPQSVSDLRLSAGGWPATIDVNRSQCTSSGTKATVSAVSASDTTLTGLLALSARSVGQYITIANAANPANNGVYQITAFVSSTSVKIANTAGVVADANNGNIRWALPGCLDNDVAIVYPIFGDHSTVINAGDGDGPNSIGSQLSVRGCSACTIAVNAGMVTFTNTSISNFSTALIGKPLVLSGATNAANNGYFYVAARPNASSLTFYNPNAVAETFTGNYSVFVGGMNKNVNVLSQTMTLGAGDVDPADKQIHIRWVMAPVLQNPGHASDEQPYVFYTVTNKTTKVLLGQNFNFTTQSGVPWQTTNVTAPDGNVVPTSFTDWQIVDIAPGNKAALGDQVQVDIYVAGCRVGGHWGRVYVDNFGATIPGFVVNATVPAFYWLDLASWTNYMVYTLEYQNNSGTAIINPEIDFSVPAGTSFASATDSNGYTCKSLAGSGTGVKVTAVNNGIATLTGLSGMSASNVGAFLTLSNATNSVNNGFFKITSFISATSMTIASGLATTENGNISWSSSHLRCSPATGGALASGATGAVTVTVNIATSTFGVLNESAYWTQGKGVSALFGSAVKTIVSGPPTQIKVSTGSPQSAAVATAFAAPAVAEVDDANGHAVMNATVTFTPPSSGPTAALAPATAVTNAFGLAQTTATAGTSAGAYELRASVSGVASAASFALTNTAGAPATVVVSSGGGQSGIVGKAFTTPIVVRVRDQYGNPVPGKTVTFTPPSGASATFSGGPFTTDANGQVTATATANATAGGPYTVNVAITGSTATASFTLTNFATPPAPTLVSPTSGAFVNTNSPKLSGTNLNGATVAVTLDGTASAATVSGTGFALASSGLSEGAHSWTAKQTLFGVASIASAAFSFTVDTVVPTVTVAASSVSNTAKPTISGVATDQNIASVAVTIYAGTGCSGTVMDTTTISAGASPYSYAYNGYATALAPDGSYTACVVATDKAGNTSAQARKTFVVDTLAPTLTLAVTTPSASNKPTLSGVATDTALASVAVAIYRGSTCSGVALDSTTITAGASPFRYSYAGYPNALTPDGTYTACATATDTGGNTSTQATQRFVVDTGAPTLTVSVPTPSGNTKPTVSGVATDPLLSSVSVAIYRGSTCSGVAVNSATIAAAASPVNYSYSGYQNALTPDGSYIVCVTAADAAGNTSTVSSQGFVIDTAAPTLTVAVTTPSGVTTPPVTGVATDPAIDHVDVVIYAGTSCSGTALNTGSLSASGSPFNFSYAGYATALAPDGNYIACVTATDKAGNKSATQAHSFVVDTTPPSVSVLVPATTASTTPTVSGVAADSNLASLSVSIYAGTSCSGTALDSTTLPAVGSPFPYTYAAYGNALTPDGTYIACVSALDAAGNQSPLQSQSFVVDTGAPTVTVSVSTPTNTDKPVVSGVATDPNIDHVDVAIYAGTSCTGSALDTTTIAASGGSPFSYNDGNDAAALTPDGTFIACVIASDKAGNTSTQASQSFVVDTTPPHASFLTPPGTRFHTAPFTLTGQMEDGTGTGVASVAVRINAGAWLPATLSDSTHWLLPFTPRAGDGIYSIEVQATDNAGNVQASPYQTLRFNYDTTPPTTVITTSAGNFDTAPIVITGTTTDGTGAGVTTVEYSSDGGTSWRPATLTDSTDWTLRFTPPSDGPFTITVRSTDALGNVERARPTVAIVYDAACAETSDCFGSRRCLPSGHCGDCQHNSDCGSGDVCVAGSCGACTQTSQCDGGFHCAPAGQCQPNCTRNADCSGGLVCTDGVCGACTSNRQCAAGEVCSGGNCTADGASSDSAAVTPEPTVDPVVERLPMARGGVGGCSCKSTSDLSDGAALAAFALFFLWRARRRSHAAK